jgi:probable F420-dependent oxidoreductase
MQLGVHLPHAGEQADPALIRRAALQAEASGIADLWVSEHIIVPTNASYPPSPKFYDPVLTLTWVAAMTRRVRLGTSVLVLPLHHPLPLAKALASLQDFSGGRLILGAGVGWLEAEFAAFGVPFRERGRRMEESLALMRAAWSEDPIAFRGRFVAGEIADMRMMPKPAAPIPLWLGGASEAALRRTIRLAQGWHGSRLAPAQAAPIVRRLRAERPDLVISMRIQWNGRDPGELAARIAGYAEIGVEHLLVAPENRETDDWEAIIAGVGRLAAA